METSAKPYPFIVLLLGKAALVFTTILFVWLFYAYLHAFHLDWIGWFYTKLLPLSNALFGLVDAYAPAEFKYKIRGAITDDLGQRSLFLLLLTAVVELMLYSAFKGLKAGIPALIHLVQRRGAGTKP